MRVGVALKVPPAGLGTRSVSLAVASTSQRGAHGAPPRLRRGAVGGGSPLLPKGREGEGAAGRGAAVRPVLTLLSSSAARSGRRPGGDPPSAPAGRPTRGPHGVGAAEPSRRAVAAAVGCLPGGASSFGLCWSQPRCLLPGRPPPCPTKVRRAQPPRRLVLCVPLGAIRYRYLSRLAKEAEAGLRSSAGLLPAEPQRVRGHDRCRVRLPGALGPRAGARRDAASVVCKERVARA